MVWHMNTIVYSWEIKAKYGSFESYMVPDNELKLGDLRLLFVDKPLVMPANALIRL